MATIFRPPLITRFAAKAITTVILSQNLVSGPPLALIYGKDKQFAGPGQFKTYDYPNPQIKGRSNSLLTHINTRSLELHQDTMFGGAGQPLTPGPFNNANPVVNKKYPIDSYTWIEFLFPWTPSGKPFKNDEWTNPLIARKPDLTHVQYLLGTTLKPSTAQPPFYTTEWPNPTTRRTTIDYLTWTEFLLPWTPSGMPFGQDDWPNPLVPRQPIDNKTITESLLPWTPSGMPFNMDDWPNPRIAGRPDITYIQNLLDSTLVFVAPPFRPIDWPNPIPRAFPVHNRNYLYYYMLAETQTPYLPFDWPNPRVAGRSTELLTLVSNLLETTLGIIVPSPFSQDDWPNPLIKVPSIDLRTFLNPLEPNLVGKDQFFGAPGQPPTYSWPNPLSADRRADLRTLVVNLLEGTLGAPAIIQSPFYNLDWPNPQGRAFPTDARTFINQVQLRLIGQDRFFGAPGQAPANLDWPNPKGYIYPVSLRTFINAVANNLIGQDQFFGAPGQPPANYDWPVPKGRPFPNRNLTETQRRVDLLGLDKFFGAPGMGPRYDYPNPLIKQPVVSLKVWLDPLKIQLLGKDQFFGAPGQVPPQRDWPNPLRYIPAIELKTFVLNLMEGTLSIPARQILIARIGNELFSVTDITSDSFVLTSISGDIATSTGITDDTDMESE